MTALMAPRADVSSGVVAQSAIASAVQSRVRVPVADAPVGELGLWREDGTNDPSDGGVGGGPCGGLCPLSTTDGVFACLNQNCDKADSEGTVACGAGGNTTENIFARCFDLAVELPNLVGTIELNEVKWAVQQFTGTVPIPITINVYSVTGCPPTVVGSVFLGSVGETVNPGDGAPDPGGRVFFSKPLTGFNQPIVLAAGDKIVVEIQATLDGTVAPLHAFRPRSSATSCTDAFLLSGSCGINDWTSVTAIGFPDSQILIQVSMNPVAGTKAVCGNGILEACEDCDDGNTVPGDGCDQNCQIEIFCGDGNCDPGEDQCNCPADCGAPPLSEAGLCSNGIDDDCDGLTDCADPDCAADPVCTPGACCLQDGTCIEVAAEADCDALNGHFTLFGDCSDPLFCSTGCFYANGNRAVAINANQCAPDAFAAAVADDFILADINLGNPCLITNITFGVSFFNQPAGVIPDPNVDWQGVMVTVYADGGTDGLTKGPGGQPVDPPPSANCDHEAYLPGGIVYSQASSDFIGVETPPGSGTWTIDVSVNMTLKKKVKYWLSVQPIMNFGGLGQIALASSDTQHGHPAQRGFPAVGLPFWVETGDYWFVLTGEKSLAPPNDACASRLAVGDGWVHFDTTNATTDGPNISCDPGFPIFHDIWYNYTAKCDGLATFSLCKDANFDTKIAIYEGCACPADPATELGCNDDFNCDGVPGNEVQSQVTIPVLAGNCYKIRIGGFDPGHFGNGTLDVSCVAAGACCLPDGSCVILPSTDCAAAGGLFQGGGTTCANLPQDCRAPANNDLCANKRAIFNGVTKFSTFFTTTDGPPACALIGSDIWYVYTSDFKGDLTISLCDQTNYDSALAVYDGNDCAAILAGQVPLGCDDDGCGVGGGPSIVTVAVDVGQVITLQVGGFNADQGKGAITITKVANADISGPGGAGFPDGCVDAFDLGVVLGAWCSTPASGNPPPDPPCTGVGCVSPFFLLADLSGPVG
ncbi:MAG: hypothetical protein O7E49_04410, partial [Gemmatimonadetes bacterium]|nr:hypothetical protein [Gemmatimonadota bacterium]